MAIKHQITKLASPLVECLCGWHHRLFKPDRWGPRAALDELLDRYNDHKRGDK